MANCLFRKYKAGINEDLVKVNELRVKVYGGSGSFLGVKNEVLRGIGTKINGETEYVLPANDWNNISFNSEGYLSVMNKYRGTFDDPKMSINIPVDYTCLEQLKYTNLRAFFMCGYYSDSASVANDFGEGITLEYLAETLPKCVLSIGLYGTKVTGDISDLYPLKDNLTALFTTSEPYREPNTLITGNFDDLGHFYKVTRYGSTLQYFANLSGTVEGFVENRLTEKPATAGSVTFENLGIDGRVTYNGSTVTSGITTIAWDAQGNITLS